jgi:hypothetical protein
MQNLTLPSPRERVIQNSQMQNANLTLPSPRERVIQNSRNANLTLPSPKERVIQNKFKQRLKSFNGLHFYAYIS